MIIGQKIWKKLAQKIPGKDLIFHIHDVNSMGYFPLGFSINCKYDVTITFGFCGGGLQIYIVHKGGKPKSTIHWQMTS